MLLIGIKYFTFLCFVFLFFLISGFFIIEISPIKYKNSVVRKYSSLLMSALTGIIFWVVFFSLIKTNFISINIFFLLLGGIFIYNNYKPYKVYDLFKQIKEKIQIFRIVFIVILFAFIFFFIESIYFLKTGDFNYCVPFADYIYYSNVSVSITGFGQENRYLFTNIVDQSIHGLSYYHYFELWLNSIVSSLTSTPNLISLMIVTYPMLFLLCFIGIVSIIELYQRVKLIHLILSFILLFVGSVALPFYNNFELFKYASCPSSNIYYIFSKKITILIPFIIISFFALLKEEFLIFYIILFILILLSIGTMPGVVAGAITLPFAVLFYKKSLFKNSVRGLLLFIVCLLTFFLYCHYFGSSFSQGYSSNNIVITALINIIKSLSFKNIVFYILFPAIRQLILYMPYLLVALFTLQKIKFFDKYNIYIKLFLLFTFSASIAGIVLSGLNLDFIGSEQFYIYITPIINIVIIIIVVSLLLNSQRSLIKYFVLGIIFTCTIANAICDFNIKKTYANYFSKGRYSDKYLKQVTDYLDTAKINPHGVCFFNEEDMKDYPLNMDGYVGSYYSGGSVKFSKKQCYLSNISICDFVIGDSSQTIQNSLMRSSDFYHYVQTLKNYKKYISINNCKITYINKFDINYFIKYKYAEIPKEYIKDIIYLTTDSISGESFIVIKN